MRNTCCLRLVTLSALLSLCSITNPAEDSFDYIVTVGGEQLHFIAQPEAGYVLKTRDDIGSIVSTSRFLKSAGDVKISPIRGLGRKGVCVVYNERTAMENSRTIKTLRGHSEVQYAVPLFSSNGETVAVIPEIVIRVKPGSQIEQVQTICETVGCKIIKRMEFTEQEYLLEVLGPDAEAVFVTVEKLGRTPEVEWACPNTASQPKLCGQSVSDRVTSDGQLEDDESEQDANSIGVFPNDEYFPLQWHLHNTGQSGGTPGADIRAPEAWEITTGDPNIVVAVIDFGVDSTHPDLIDNLVPGYDFYDSDDLPDPALDHFGNAHGTCCGGLIAAQGNNGIGVTGVTWDCKIMPIRICWRSANGTTYWITEADRAMALRWTANKGADILSNSWHWSANPTPIIESAIVDVTKLGGIGRSGKGCVVFFCAGNDSGPLTYPGKYPEVIVVGATDHNDVRCYYSNYGPELDVVAPSSAGVGDSALTSAGGRGWLWTTDIYGPAGYSGRPGYPYPEVLDSGLFQGTSGACPIAAGVAALILSVDPNLTNLEVKRILYRSAHDLGEPGWDQYYGWGRVDARAAVEMVLNPQPLYVDDDAQNDPGPGDPNISDSDENGSAEHPFDSIQKAINYSLDTEEIVILSGKYAGEGNRDIDFGGKILNIRSEAGPAACVIDCQGLGRGFDFHSGEGCDSVLEGFTIINGKSDSGGAISFMNKSSPTVRNCIFSNNIATAVGGAVNNAEGAATLINCTFYANKDLLGGGAISNFSNGMIITNCIIRDNEPGEIYSFGTMDVTYSNISGGFAGECNIDADPLFADADNGDYHLKSQTGRLDPNNQNWVKDDLTSPCIDVGDPNSDFSGETWPHGGRINMGAYGGTHQASMSLETGGMMLPRVAFIYSHNNEVAENFKSLLGSYGCSTNLINMDDVPAAPLDSYDLIIVGNDTGLISHLGNAESVAAIESSGKPVVGLGEGGYALFGQLGLSIGSPNGAHGSRNSIEVIDPNCSLFSSPYSIEIPADRVLQLYTDTEHVGIYLWPTIPETVTALGSEVNNFPYYPLATEYNRYLLWSFTESPEMMTEIGKTLFINVVIWTANKAWESNI